MTETEKNSVWGGLAASYRKGRAAGYRQATTPRLAVSLLAGSFGLGGNIVSLIKGYNVAYLAPIGQGNTPKRWLRLLGITVQLHSISGAAWTVATRLRNPEVIMVENVSSSAHVGRVISSVLIEAHALRTLTTGKGLRGKRELSRYGRVVTAAGMVSAGYTALESSVMLYRSRERWLPILREDVDTTRVVAPIYWNYLKTRVTGREPDDITVNEDDLDALYDYLRAHGGEINTSPDD